MGIVDELRYRLWERTRWAELCRRVGISPSSLSRFIHDKAGLETSSLNRLSEELGLTLISWEFLKELQTLHVRYLNGELRPVEATEPLEENDENE